MRDVFDFQISTENSVENNTMWFLANPATRAVKVIFANARLISMPDDTLKPLKSVPGITTERVEWNGGEAVYWATQIGVAGDVREASSSIPWRKVLVTLKS